MTLFQGFGIWSSSGPTGAPGMVLLKPTSIAHSGTSASIGANGQVTFTAVTSLSLNGVFSADFDNYVVSMRLTGGASLDVRFRVRVNGTDNSTASSYVEQYILADSTSVTAARRTNNYATMANAYNTQRSGSAWHVYGPALAQPTAFRSIGSTDSSSAMLLDFAATHNQSTSYDGFTVFPDNSNITGALQVYGVRS